LVDSIGLKGKKFTRKVELDIEILVHSVIKDTP